jgi:hypothetical protein
LNRRILENLFLGAGTPRRGVALRKFGGERRIALVERDEFRAGVRQAIDLPMDVPVIGADDADLMDSWS